MKFGLIFSNDWELYGDGSGDYFKIQHTPLLELAKVAHERGVKLTIMAEVGQQFAHQKLAKRTVWAREIAEAWEGILTDLIKAGDDVQMHLHPQWLDAEHEDGRWRLNYKKWAISSLASDEMEAVFRRAKAYLEGLLKPTDPGYECIAFRAGAYCIQPSMRVAENLRKVGVVCDTSVVPGMYHPPLIDFRDAYSNVLPWHGASREIKYKSREDSGLLEIPLCSYSGIDIPILRRFVSRDLSDLLCFGTRTTEEERQWIRRRQAIVAERYPVANRPFDGAQAKNRSLKDKLRWILAKATGGKRAFTLDYDQLPASIFVKCVERIYRSETLHELRSTDVVVPFMVTGHVKNMHNCDNVKRIWDGLDRSLRGRIMFWTLAEAVDYWIGRGLTQLATASQGTMKEAATERSV